ETGVSRRPVKRLFSPPRVEGESLTGSPDDETISILDTEMITTMLSPEGNFAQAFPNYEYRQQQVDMVEAVCGAFNEGEHLFVEAGTGTGKSIGYLLPASFWAEANKRHVVVSTNTINLQDQLISKDIPQLQKMLPFPVRAAILKGKRNYLCTRLFEQRRRRGPSSADEMTLFARILCWLPHSKTVARAEITLRRTSEQQVWG
ncbi:MAG: hypothetical protein KAG66_23405, partial [Methylococcales bacterium]|nr:hypothetical protein [Methylococcales bacterium]